MVLILSYKYERMIEEQNFTFSNVENIEIRTNVRQGCILFPFLFNVYSEKKSTKALEKTNESIKINRETINNIRYVNDTVGRQHY